MSIFGHFAVANSCKITTETTEKKQRLYNTEDVLPSAGRLVAAGFLFSGYTHKSSVSISKEVSKKND